MKTKENILKSILLKNMTKDIKKDDQFNIYNLRIKHFWIYENRLKELKTYIEITKNIKISFYTIEAIGIGLINITYYIK